MSLGDSEGALTAQVGLGDQLRPGDMQLISAQRGRHDRNGASVDFGAS